MALDIHGIAPLLQVFDMPIAVRFYRDVLGSARVTPNPARRSSDSSAKPSRSTPAAFPSSLPTAWKK